MDGLEEDRVTPSSSRGPDERGPPGVWEEASEENASAARLELVSRLRALLTWMESRDNRRFGVGPWGTVPRLWVAATRTFISWLLRNDGLAYDGPLLPWICPRCHQGMAAIAEYSV